MRIVHIAAGMSFGGVAEVVAMLALAQRKLGCDVAVVTVAGESDDLISSMNNAGSVGVKVVRFEPSVHRRLFFSWRMLFGLNGLIKNVDLVHVHSNWTFPVWWGCLMALKNGTKLVMTPHGCLSPARLAHSKWKKRLASIIDRYFLKRADVIHATCEAEADDIRCYLCGSEFLESKSSEDYSNIYNLQLPINEQQRSKIFVIPNGVNLKEFEGDINRNFWKKRYPEIGDKKIFLALGRIHPLKGLDLLIDAVACIVQDGQEIDYNAQLTNHCLQQSETETLPTISQQSSTAPGWVLIIAGPDEQGTLMKLKFQVSRCKLDDYVLFDKMISPSERAEAIASAYCLVLPSRHENFGLSAAESLACGVPVIASKGTPWSELQGNSGTVNSMLSLVNGEISHNLQFTTHNLHSTDFGRCGWWVDADADSLAKAMKEALDISAEERKSMGLCGRKLIEEKYQWYIIGQQMLEIYK